MWVDKRKDDYMKRTNWKEMSKKIGQDAHMKAMEYAFSIALAEKGSVSTWQKANFSWARNAWLPKICERVGNDLMISPKTVRVWFNFLLTGFKSLSSSGTVATWIRAQSAGLKVGLIDATHLPLKVQVISYNAKSYYPVAKEENRKVSQVSVEA